MLWSFSLSPSPVRPGADSRAGIAAETSLPFRLQRLLPSPLLRLPLESTPWGIGAPRRRTVVRRGTVDTARTM